MWVEMGGESRCDGDSFNEMVLLILNNEEWWNQREWEGQNLMPENEPYQRLWSQKSFFIRIGNDWKITRKLSKGGFNDLRIQRSQVDDDCGLIDQTRVWTRRKENRGRLMMLMWIDNPWWWGKSQQQRVKETCWYCCDCCRFEREIFKFKECQGKWTTVPSWNTDQGVLFICENKGQERNPKVFERKLKEQEPEYELGKCLMKYLPILEWNLNCVDNWWWFRLLLIVDIVWVE